MEQDKIEAMLKKYWRAETNVEEEKTLKKYFETYGFPPHLTEDVNWFKTVNVFKSVEVKEVHFLPSPDKIAVRKINWAIILKIAATVLLVIGASMWGIKYNNSLQAEDELVLQRKAETDLLSISNSLNQASSGLNEIIILKANVKIPNQ